MYDFVYMAKKTIGQRNPVITIKAGFDYTKADRDLQIKGHAFSAIYNEETHLWEQSINAAARLIDADMRVKIAHEFSDRMDTAYEYLPATHSSSGTIDEFLRFCKNCSDSSFELDPKIHYANEQISREDHATFVLPYSLSSEPCPAWEELVGTLYEPEERAKLEWFIGAAASNSNLEVDKIAILYGPPGSGKSTVLNIIQGMFGRYAQLVAVSDLGGANVNAFAAESIAANTPIGIQQDGDLSRISDNSYLNSICSHEEIRINEKFKSQYTIKPRTILFMGTNKPVTITDAKSGLARRVVDIHPSENLIESSRYDQLMSHIKYEYGAIAQHCINVFNQMGAKAYRKYTPFDMVAETNVTYSFLADNYETIVKNDYITLKQLWDMYTNYIEESHYKYSLNKTAFKNEMKSYFSQYSPDTRRDGVRYINLFSGFKKDRIRPTAIFGKDGEAHYIENAPEKLPEPKSEPLIMLSSNESAFDRMAQKWPAQYATKDGTPRKAWDKVTTTLSDINTRKLHYVRVPENHIVIDFDLKDENGNKDQKKNLQAATAFPPTYAEFSKGGAGVHLHYIYDGDVSRLSSLYSPDIEIKVFTGKSSLRRRLSYCNDKEIAHISGGLPLRERSKTVLDKKEVKSEKALRTLITRALRKEYGATRPCVDFIIKVTEEAYEGGTSYDISDLKPDISQFAMHSTHQSKYCMAAISKIHWCSKGEISSGDPDPKYEDDRIVFFDIEVFPNLLLVNWKYDGSGEWAWNEDHTEWKYTGPVNTVNRMINPSPQDIADLFKFKLVGYNNLGYDNIILYARYLGSTIEECYNLSKRIINGERGIVGYSAAKNVSYTDVYDFASAGNKKSLKKWELELGMYHDELEYPFDKPIPEEDWQRVAEYCDNDVISTEAVFHFLKGDWTTRQMLADIADMPVNTTSNNLCAHIIFGDLADRRYS